MAFQQIRKFRHRSSLHLRYQPCLERLRHQRGVRTLARIAAAFFIRFNGAVNDQHVEYLSDEVQSLDFGPESQTGKCSSGVETIVVAQFFFGLATSSRITGNDTGSHRRRTKLLTVSHWSSPGGAHSLRIAHQFTQRVAIIINQLTDDDPASAHR